MAHGRNPGFKPGNHWVVCDKCGFDYPASEMKKQWDGLVVCQQDYEPRHPQDFVRGVEDRITSQGLVRPVPAETTRTTNDFDDVNIGSSEDYTVPTGTHTGSL